MNLRILLVCLSLIPFGTASAETRTTAVSGARSAVATPGWGRRPALERRAGVVRAREASATTEHQAPRIGKIGWQRAR